MKLRFITDIGGGWFGEWVYETLGALLSISIFHPNLILVDITCEQRTTVVVSAVLQPPFTQGQKLPPYHVEHSLLIRSNILLTRVDERRKIHPHIQACKLIHASRMASVCRLQLGI